jgi:hypothetical protein
MSNTALNSRLDASQWEPKFPFDLVVCYEDTYTRNRALHLYDHLAQQLLDDYDFQCSWWKFDHLSNATLGQQAADAAAEANMIVLSVHARPDLLPLHKDWIEDWLPRRDNRKSALVALIAGADRPEREAALMLTYLQRTARLGRMDFFTHTFDTPRPGRELSAQELAERARAVTPLLQDILHHKMPIPRWGINE